MGLTRKDLWRCRECGALIRGRKEGQRSQAQLEHARRVGHRAAVEPYRPKNALEWRLWWGSLPVAIQAWAALTVVMLAFVLSVWIADQQKEPDPRPIITPPCFPIRCGP